LNKKAKVSAVVLAVSTAVSGGLKASDRDYVHIVGSSTVAPFSAAVSEHLAKSAKLKKPWLESTGTGGGFTLFCDSAASDTPDIINASRRMRKKELETCERNGIKDVVEVKIGYDGIVFIHAKKEKPIGLSRKDIYLALAKSVPDPACKADCKLVPNPYQTWKQVNPALPDVKIEVYGPGAASGTRDALNELVMEEGCRSYPWLVAKKEKTPGEYKKACYGVRDDGAYVETRENDEAIAERLVDKPHALAVHDYKLLAAHAKHLSAEPVDGVTPDYSSIASLNYPVSRALYFYFRGDRIGKVPGLAQYVKEFTGEKAWGDKGYLVDKGLIALPAAERKLVAEDAKAVKPLTLESLQAPAR
jgi:phosphate transport system substrate-binding protein